MNLYNIVVSLNGNPLNQVTKEKVTAAEIAVLTQIHGEGSVKVASPAGTAKVEHRVLREQLAERYSAKMRTREGAVDGNAVLAELFGRSGQLPQSVEDLQFDVPGVNRAAAEADSAAAALLA